MSKKKEKKRRATRSEKNRTPLEGHQRQGKTLVPPFLGAAGTKTQLASWMNERLPEMLWATLVIAATDREYALAHFRKVLGFVAGHSRRADLWDFRLSGIARLEPMLRKDVIAAITDDSPARTALAQMCFYPSLPGLETWEAHLPKREFDGELLMRAVGGTLWHQSQEATDIRWLRAAAQLVAGKLHIPEAMTRSWLNYPNESEMHTVHTGIRAAELSLGALAAPSLEWPDAFWDHNWKNPNSSKCIPLPLRAAPQPVGEIVTRRKVQETVELVEHHWAETHSTTSIDPKHDGVFGMALYALRVLEEMFTIGIGTSVLGRLGLRTILELRINLHYLLQSTRADIWQSWRAYGAGQTKLAALKFDEMEDLPSFVDAASVEMIAGEDLWEEFREINLASWSGQDLRKLSEACGLKDLYDKYYGWTSGYAHSMWGPIREACFSTCGNPLHRLHRRPVRGTLNDAVTDAAILVDGILDDVDASYPSFRARLGSKPPTNSAPPEDPPDTSVTEDPPENPRTVPPPEE